MNTVTRATIVACICVAFGCGRRPAPDDNVLYPIQDHNRWGYIDYSGQVIIQPRFAEATPFAEDLAAVKSSESGKWGYIDRTGVFVIQPTYDTAGNFTNGLACVAVDQKYGYINKMGAAVVSPQYDKAYSFTEGLALIRVGDAYGYIDTQGKTIIKPSFELASGFCEGLAWVGTWEGSFGFIDKTGRVVIERRFDEAKVFSEGLAAVKQGLFWHYINKAGEMVIKKNFGRAREFSEGLGCVEGMPSEYGFVNKTGYFVIIPKFEMAWEFSEGYAVIRSGDKYGYINRRGRIAIKPRFDDAFSFSHGLAYAKLGKKNLYIDKRGRVVWEGERDRGAPTPQSTRTDGPHRAVQQQIYPTDHQEAAATDPNTWEGLVTEAERLKKNKPLVGKYFRLDELLNVPTSQLDLAKLSHLAELSPEIHLAFSNVVELLRNEDEEDHSRARQRFSAAILHSARSDDLPFLLHLLSLIEVGPFIDEELAKTKLFTLGLGFGEEIPDVPTAIEQVTLRLLKTDREATLGLLLCAIEQPSPPESFERLCRQCAELRDPRALPALVRKYRGAGFMVDGEVIATTILAIDPHQELMSSYFERCEEYVRGTYVPAEVRSARKLRNELGSITSPSGASDRVKGHEGVVSANSGAYTIRVKLPPKWEKKTVPLTEAEDAILTLSRKSQGREDAWVAFSLVEMPKGSSKNPMVLLEFDEERIEPFGETSSMPGYWPDGERNYWQVPWTPKRKMQGSRLRAQTSVLWNWDRGLRFEIVQVFVDDGSLFAFRDKVGFAFDVQVLDQGKPLFPK